ncbi:glycosyltransferase [Mucilaginibacter sp. HD30]
MKVLQTVKYYLPSKGGMETVVKNIVEGISAITSDTKFTIYANHNHKNSKEIIEERNIKIIKEITPFLFKSQPLNFRYSSLRSLIDDADIIHHHYPFPNMELALIRNLDLLKTKKLIITWHANIQNSRWRMLANIYDPLIEKLLNIALFIVVTSPQLLEYSDILKKHQEKVVVIPLSYSPKMNVSEDFVRTIIIDRPRNVLFVGKLRAYKGVCYLIDAITHTDYLLTIVGDGEEENSLKQQVANLSLESRVRFFKNVSDEELSNIYKNSDLFVLPSVTEAEAFGVVQLEAMANGLPVINTNLKSGVPFVSIHQVTGLTVEPRNVEQLTSALKYILNDSEVYNKFSVNSKERAKLFSIEKLAESYLKLYES